MSEEILKALMQLFAIIAKQDTGLSLNEREYVNMFLKQQLSQSAVEEYLALFDSFAGFNDIQKEKEEEEGAEPKKAKLTSVKDSVKTLGICKKINKTLTQKQKIVVMVRLFEIINSDKQYTEQRMAIINTVAEAFNISKEEYQTIETFVSCEDVRNLKSADILVAHKVKDEISVECKFIESNIDGSILIMRIASVDLYFLRYVGYSSLLMNGLDVDNKRVYLFAQGSVLKLPKDKPIFYTDVAAKFLADSSQVSLSFTVSDLEYTFPNGNIGLRNVNIVEGSGKLIGIMGASGAGKTTLLNVLSGIETPSNGSVLINGVDLHKQNEELKGIIGYIPQDDLLIEELSVFENLYYSCKLVYKDISEEETKEKVMKVLNNLGLAHIRHLKVGNPLQKTISGGQRKRLNIGLELIREPGVLFVDEPTSGLSSRDSENVMELLRELSMKGKLIFVVIHQPSSDIYKMFDNLIILDTGGYQIYYGNPVEAVVYFKTQDAQVNSDIGECPTCGNVNPETIFNIIEARIVDEYGKATKTRKRIPTEWYSLFKSNISLPKASETFEKLPSALNIPKKLSQLKIYFLRDMFAKIANTQYLVMNFVQAPLIAAILAFILRYISDPNSSVYIFRENENIMPYVFMAIIVALFLGLIVSAEEIYKDRKILKREEFLNLSRRSYLLAKISILFIISAAQSFLFVLVANSILGIHGMFLEYWITFFSMSAFANMLGLNISATFNSAVTIYILIPFLIIPQMVLAGAMFNFDKINKWIGGGQEKVPIIAEIMPSRWGFEGLLVNQFINNEYEKIEVPINNNKTLPLYEVEKLESQANYKNVYYIPELKSIIEEHRFAESQSKVEKEYNESDILLLRNEIAKEMSEVPEVKFNDFDKISSDKLNNEVEQSILEYLDELQGIYKERYNFFNSKKDNLFSSIASDSNKSKIFQQLKDDYYNDYLATFAKNVFALKPLVRIDNHFVQKIDPIYLDPQDQVSWSYRSHFLSPKKQLFGMYFDTFWVNIITVWLFTVFMYVTLYFESLKKGLESASVLNEKISNMIKTLKSKREQKKKENSIKNENK